MTLALNRSRDFGICTFVAVWVGVLAIACLFVGLAHSPAHAVLIAQDGFDYEVGPLDTQSGGSGWLGPWAGGTATTMDNPLNHADSQGNQLATSGKAMQLTDWATTGRQWDLSGVDASLLDSSRDNMFGADGATLWVSFLGMGTEVGRSADIQLSASFDGLNFEKRWALGRPYKVLLDGTQGDDNVTWGFMDYRMNTLEPDTFRSAGVSYDEQVLYVARVDFLAGDDAISVWIDPDLDQEPAVADSVINSFVIEDSAVNAISFSGPADTFFDELRVGTTYADVAPFSGGNPDTGPGDFAGDGIVEVADLTLLLDNWNKPAEAAWVTDRPSPEGANVAGDELTLLLDNWTNDYTSSSFAAATIPEPSTMAIALLASIGGLVFRRAR